MRLIDLISEARGKGSQATLAVRLGVAQPTISGWERGTSLPPRTRIPALAAALGRPVAEIEAIVAADRAARLADPVVEYSRIEPASCPACNNEPATVTQ